MKARGFERRYVFRGTLVLKTGLHIGSGWATGSVSDSPIIRTPDGSPFIPGSSFKGAFRSTVEKLALTIGRKCCALMEAQGCVGAQGEEQKEFNKQRRDANWKDSQLLDELDEHLCDTCKLFGSPYMASRITFADLLPPENDLLADKMVQVRDGVAIHRDSEKALDGLKYDYEVVAPSQTFELEIMLDDPSDCDLSLTCLGLNEFISGFGYIGGKRSRGLANCQIQDLKIYELDLSDPDERAERIKNYVINKTLDKKMTCLSNVESFLEEQIGRLL